MRLKENERNTAETQTAMDPVTDNKYLYSINIPESQQKGYLAVPTRRYPVRCSNWEGSYISYQIDLVMVTYKS